MLRIWRRSRSGYWEACNFITNDSNHWVVEHHQPRYILNLLLSIINVSVLTVDIVERLPPVDWQMEWGRR